MGDSGVLSFWFLWSQRMFPALNGGGCWGKCRALLYLKNQRPFRAVSRYTARSSYCLTSAVYESIRTAEVVNEVSAKIYRETIRKWELLVHGKAIPLHLFGASFFSSILLVHDKLEQTSIIWQKAH